MVRRLVVLAAIAGVVGFGVFWLITIPATVSASALASRPANVDNGRQLFLIGGCASCHATPNQDDKTRLGGGVALKSPFGTFFTPNISSDKTDGIGSWTEAQFVTAMTKGTSPDGSHYYPAFPYTSYQHMTYDDVRDVFGYLETLPAVQGKARDHDLPMMFRWRRTLGGWKFLFLDGAPFTPDPAMSEQWNRGAYLVNGPGHCAECHSPRNKLGGIIASQRFAGGPAADGEGWVPNITQYGIGDYTLEQITTLLKTGDTPGGDSVGGEMGKVVANIGKINDADRAAMAAYLKWLPPVEGPKQPEQK